MSAVASAPPHEIRARWSFTSAEPDFDYTGLEKRYGKVSVRDFDGQKEFESEMDALVAYLQVLGTMVNFKEYNPDIMPAKTQIKEVKDAN